MEDLSVNNILKLLTGYACYGCAFFGRYDVLLAVSILTLFYCLFIRKLTIINEEDYKERPRVRIDEPYDGEEHSAPKLKNVPVVSGWLGCKIARFMVSNTYFRKWFLHDGLMRNLTNDAFKNVILPEEATFHPLVKGDSSLYDKQPIKEEELWKLIEGRRADGNDGDRAFQFVSISDLVLLYREGKKTPETLMKNLIHCLKESEKHKKPLKAFIEYYEDNIMEQAIASTKRWKEGKPLSILDGIPVGVKDQFIVGKHHCREGLPLDVPLDNISSEKGLVKKLRDGGAILVGMTNMFQIGIGITGLNQSKFHGNCRNPYNVSFTTGGSSSGSASAVASGLSVIALGTDGGGSIRIPAGYCGIVGLKATYGCYSGAGMKSGSITVGHPGALCSTVRDMAITFGFLAGKDKDYPVGLIQPPIYLGDFDNLDLSGIRVGVDWAWIKGADPKIQAGCENALKWLRDIYHVEIIDIHFPEKVEVAAAHLITITTEMSSSSRKLYDVFHDDLNLDVFTTLGIAKDMDAFQYLQAAKQRTRSINALKYIFSQVDVILTPAYFCFQPKIQPQMDYGYANSLLIKNVIAMNNLGNLTGVPAMTFPVGYTQENLPVSVELFSSWWREDILLKVGYALEHCVKRQTPQVYFDIRN